MIRKQSFEVTPYYKGTRVDETMQIIAALLLHQAMRSASNPEMLGCVVYSWGKERKRELLMGNVRVGLALVEIHGPRSDR